MTAADEPIVVEQTFDANLTAVWRAITKVEQMREWYFEIDAFEPEVGFRTEFDVKCGGRTFRHLWRITDVVSEGRIAYSWAYREYPGEALVVFDLFQQGQQTTLRLTSTVIDAFPQNIPEFNRESGVAGWAYFIQQSLPQFLSRESS